MHHIYFLSFLPSTLALQPAFQPPSPLLPRQNLCPVPCGQGWCCLTGTKCISGKSDPAVIYDCNDELLKTVWPAIHVSVFTDAVTIINSIAPEYSLSSFVFKPTTASPTFTPTLPIVPFPTSTGSSGAAGKKIGVAMGAVAGLVGAGVGGLLV